MASLAFTEYMAWHIMDAILSKSYRQRIATDDLSSSVALGV